MLITGNVHSTTRLPGSLRRWQAVHPASCSPENAMSLAGPDVCWLSIYVKYSRLSEGVLHKKKQSYRFPLVEEN